MVAAALSAGAAVSPTVNEHANEKDRREGTRILRGWITAARCSFLFSISVPFSEMNRGPGEDRLQRLPPSGARHGFAPRHPAGRVGMYAPLGNLAPDGNRIRKGASSKDVFLRAGPDQIFESNFDFFSWNSCSEITPFCRR
jgi:hypothetical protein